MASKVEILSPAGSFETLKAAVASGADAVYFGASTFNARRKAQNFSDEEIKDVVSYCHARGVKAHLTLNTLIFNNEIETALRLAKIAADSEIDAIIIQDIGLASLIHKCAPTLTLHASTQLSCHNIDGVMELAKLGFSRVVLARELTKDEIKNIVELSPIETEIFVHGALCMSVSGQCYMSEFFGGSRSANRGLCAQPCRLPFTVENNTNVLSLKDLSLIDNIREIQEIGVTSLKIEGRLKRPEYVALATRLYKKASTGDNISEEDKLDLKQIFSRSGFTQGYYNNKRDSSMFGIRSKEDVTTTAKTFKRIRSYYENIENPSIKVDFDFKLDKNQSSLSCTDTDNNQVYVLGAKPELVKAHPLSEDIIKQKLSKTGATPFYIGVINVDIDSSYTLSISEINNMRRKALSALLEKRQAITPIPFVNEISLNQNPNQNKKIDKPKIRITAYNASQLQAIIKKLDVIFSDLERVFVPLNLIKCKEVNELVKNKVKVGIRLPRALFNGTKEVESELIEAKNFGINDALCSNVGNIDVARRIGFSIHGDFGLNITNQQSLEVYKELGLNSAVLSFENPMSNVREIQVENIAKGLTVYGLLPLMLVRNCPVKSFDKCKASGCFIKDRRDNIFPLICNKRSDSASEILNPIPLYLSDKKNEILGSNLDFVNFFFTTEDELDTANIISSWYNEAKTEKPFTRGLYFKSVD